MIVLSRPMSSRDDSGCDDRPLDRRDQVRGAATGNVARQAGVLDALDRGHPLRRSAPTLTSPRSMRS
jgi:hypothetical protein